MLPPPHGRPGPAGPPARPTAKRGPPTTGRLPPCCMPPPSTAARACSGPSAPPTVAVAEGAS
eukprot:8164925-Lingulodinium_polyedra.AAC.1